MPHSLRRVGTDDETLAGLTVLAGYDDDLAAHLRDARQEEATLAAHLRDARQEEATLAADLEARLEAYLLGEVLTSMPGLGFRTALKILTIIGDGAAFPTTGHLVAYAGLAPVTRRSGSSIRGETCSQRGNDALKSALLCRLSPVSPTRPVGPTTTANVPRASDTTPLSSASPADAPTSCSPCSATAPPTAPHRRHPPFPRRPPLDNAIEPPDPPAPCQYVRPEAAPAADAPRHAPTLAGSVSARPDPALFALAIGAFAIDSTESVRMGLLPKIAADLRVSVPAVGYAISAYALGVFVGALTLTALSTRMPHQRVLAGLEDQVRLVEDDGGGHHSAGQDVGNLNLTGAFLGRRRGTVEKFHLCRSGGTRRPTLSHGHRRAAVSPNSKMIGSASVPW
jgi:hypothetical protein